MSRLLSGLRVHVQSDQFIICTFLTSFIWTRPSFRGKKRKRTSPVSPILQWPSPPDASASASLMTWVLPVRARTNNPPLHPFLSPTPPDPSLFFFSLTLTVTFRFWGGDRQTGLCGTVPPHPTPPSDSDTVQSLCGGHIGHLCPVPQSGHSLHPPTLHTPSDKTE